MNILNKIQRLVRGSAVLALVAIPLLSGSAKAATIKMECKVVGYSTAGWIEIRTGSGTGGRVQRDSLGRSYTDRVQRGEQLRITYSPDSPSEVCKGGKWGGIFKFDHGFRSTSDFGRVKLPYTLTVTCPKDPNWDNVQADILTSRGYFVKRIPIGSR